MYVFALCSILNRDAVAPYSPGLAASATLGSLAKELFNRKAVAPFPRRIKIGATALRLGFYQSLTQGSRSGNAGLKVTTALRFAATLRIRPGIFQSPLDPFVSRQRSRKLLVSIGRKSRALVQAPSGGAIIVSTPPTFPIFPPRTMKR